MGISKRLLGLGTALVIGGISAGYFITRLFTGIPVDTDEVEKILIERSTPVITTFEQPQAVKAMRQNRPIEQLELKHSADSFLFDGKNMWVAGQGKMSIVSVHDRKIMGFNELGEDSPLNMTFDGESVWAAYPGIRKFGANGYVIKEISHDDMYCIPYDVASDGNSIWVPCERLDHGYEILRLNKEGRIVSRVRADLNWNYDVPKDHILFDGEDIWIAKLSSLRSINPQIEGYRDLPVVADRIIDIASDKQNVWVMGERDNSNYILRINRVTGGISVEINLGKVYKEKLNPMFLEYKEPYLWAVVSSDSSNHLMRIDPRARDIGIEMAELPNVIFTENTNRNIEYDGRNLWLPSSDEIGEIKTYIKESKQKL